VTHSDIETPIGSGLAVGSSSLQREKFQIESKCWFWIILLANDLSQNRA